MCVCVCVCVCVREWGGEGEGEGHTHIPSTPELCGVQAIVPKQVPTPFFFFFITLQPRVE